MNIPGMLSMWARLTPEAVAVVDGDVAVTYAELHRAAQRIAHRLRAGARPGQPLRRNVLACMRKSARAVAALHGVMLAGGTYVPADPTLPLERLRHLLDATDSLCVMLDDDEDDVPGLDRVRDDLPRVRLDDALFAATPQQAEAPAIELPWTDGDPAAILFTSGSTGQPKGAVIAHGNLRAFVGWAVQALGLTPSDRLASHASLSFDLSFFDLFAATAAGASTALVPAAATGSGALMLSFMRTARPTVWQSVPSALGLIADHARSATAARWAAEDFALRWVLFAGERMPVPRLQSLLDLFPAATFANVYGCTETNDTFWYVVPRDRALPDPLPIGRALPGVTYRLLGEGGQPVPAGSPGLLWVAAPTVMAGYLRSTENQSVFRDLPDDGGALRRFYGTRDQVVEHADGDLRFLGRVDGVVKVSGFRVSLQEVEDRIAENVLVDEVAVLAIPDERLGHRMLAVVRPGHEARLNTLDMKVYCAQRMARHMVPQSFAFSHEPLPKSPNGKVDKKLLARAHAPVSPPLANQGLS